jgi:tetratricopeptide (TPR) repeat protein
VARLADLEALQSYADGPDSAASEEVAAPAGRKSAGGDDFQYSAEEVLAEFKKGLENVVQPHDVETHYDLGIAYREMGLIDEAIAEFNLARQGGVGQKKEIDCLTMIALLHQLKGDPQSAIESLKQALACQQVTADIQKGLEYDLGSAWEKAGKPGKALYRYQKASALDRNYRDVARVVARLSATCKPESDPALSRRDSRNGARSERDDSGRSAAKADGESTRAAGARPGRVRTAAK